MMDFLIKLAQRINKNVITRNLVLATSAILVFVCVVNLLLNLFTRHGQVRDVPDLSGMTMEEAERAADHAGLRISINDSLYMPTYKGGVILEQIPAVGAKVKSGRMLLVTINASSQKRVKLPYVAGYSLRQAKNNLEMAGLEIDKIIYRSDLATNNVLEQQFGGKLISASSNVEAELGSGVTLVVGYGEEAVAPAVPRIVGFTSREAKSRLWEAGFNVGKVSSGEGINPLNERDAKVSLQSPGVGSRPGFGATVNFTITLDEKEVTAGLKKADAQAREAAKAQEAENEEVEAESKPTAKPATSKPKPAPRTNSGRR